MNRKTGNGFQFVLGLGIVTLLWVIGWLACDPFDWLLNVELDGIYQILDIVLTVTPFLICLYLILLSVLGKRNILFYIVSCLLTNYSVPFWRALIK